MWSLLAFMGQAAASTCGPTPATSGDVVASVTPAGSSATLEIPVGNGASEGAAAFFVRAPADLADAQLVARFCGTAAGALTLTAPASGEGPRPAELKVSGLDPTSAPEGYLLWTKGDRSGEFARFGVVRVGQAEVRLLQANAERVVTTTTNSDAVEVALTIGESGKGGAGTVQVALGPLAGPEGRVATLEVEPSSFTLAKGESRPLKVRGSVSGVGEWRGQLTASFGGRAERWDVVVNRPESAALTLDVVPPPVVVCEPLGAWLGLCPDTVSVDLTVTNPGRAAAVAQPPRVTRLVSASNVGAALPPSEDAAWRDVGSGLHHETLTVPVPDGPGPWTGTVQMATRSGAVSVATFTLHVKRSPVGLLLALFLGTAASWFVHDWSSRGRKVNLNLANVARVREGLREAEGISPRAFAALVRRLDRLTDRIEEEPAYDPATDLADVARLAGVVERVDTSGAEARAMLALVEDPAARRRLEDALEQQGARLRSGNLDVLVRLEESAAAVLAEVRRVALEAMAAAETRFATSLTGARPDVVRARAAFEALGAMPGADASTEVLLARRRAVRDLADQLAASVASDYLRGVAGTGVPAWFQGDWAGLQRSVAEALARGDVEGAVRAWATSLAENGARWGAARAKQDGGAAEAARVVALADAARGADMGAALQACEALVQTLGAATGNMGDEAPMPALGRMATVTAPPVWQAREPADIAELRKLRTSRDHAVLAISLVVSVAVGVGALWAARDDFGSWSDLIAALLWGFGVQEAGRLTVPVMLKDRLGTTRG